LLGLGRGPVVIRLGDDAGLLQALHPREIEAGEVALRVGGGQLRLLLAGIQLHEHLAGPDHLAGSEGDPLDDAGQVRAHGDALDGGHRADGAHRRRPRLLLRDDGGHSLRRRLKGRALRHGAAYLADLYGTHGRDKDDHRDQHYDHPFLHDDETPFRHPYESRPARLAPRAGEAETTILSKRRLGEASFDISACDPILSIIPGEGGGIPAEDGPHSYRKAMIGSTRLAWRAGSQTARRATALSSTGT